MQDNPLHIDKKFTDQAWGEMRKLLDEEMPTGKRRRRFGWWWFLLALGIATTAGAFYLLSHSEEAQAPVRSAPVASPEKQSDTPAVSNEKPSDTASEAVTFTEGKIEKKGPGITSAKGANAKPEPQSSANQTQAQTQTQNTDNQFLTEILPLTDNPTAEYSEPVLSPTVAENSVSEITVLEPTVPQLGKPDLLACLPLTKLPTNAAESPSLKVETMKKARVNWSAFTSAFTAPNSNANGLAAGLLASAPLKKSNLSIEAGLGYTYFQQPLVAVGEEDGSGGFDPNATPTITEDNGRVTFENNDENYLSQAVAEANFSAFRIAQGLDLHYLQVPLEATYRWKRLRVIGGMNTGLLLRSKSDFTNGGLFFDSFSKDRSGGSGVTVKAVDFAGVGGLGYDISPRIGIDLKYRAGITDLLPDNDSKDRNRFLQLSVRYRIRE